jgi:hypothetical protein
MQQFKDDSSPIFYCHQLVLGREYKIIRMVIRCVPGSYRALALLRSPYEDDLWLLLLRPNCYFFRHTEKRKINRGILHYTMMFQGWYTPFIPHIKFSRR